MKKQAMNERLKAYYRGHQLSPGKLDELLELAKDSTQVNRDGTVSSGDLRNVLGQHWFWQRNLAIAVSVLVVIFSAIYTLQPKGISPAELTELVSKEIALNHNNRLALEFQVNDYHELSLKMDKLDFAPLSPQGPLTAGLKLIGSRYCSVHGQLAAQVALQDKKGRLYTLYQTALNDDLSRIPEGEHVVNGVMVQQWQEAGLFFGLARNLQ